MIFPKNRMLRSLLLTLMALAMPFLSQAGMLDSFDNTTLTLSALVLGLLFVFLAFVTVSLVFYIALLFAQKRKQQLTKVE